MNDFRLTPEVFTILSGLVEERLGLHYSFRDREIFADKIASRAREAGFDSGIDYYYFLRYDAGGAAELDLLAEALVVNETYFFREIDALRAIVEAVLRPLVAEGARPRVWSAACSTGEEPLSLAMLLEDAGILSKVQIVASDLSQRVLERARAGSYRGRSLRSTPEAYRERWFDIDGDQVTLRGDLPGAIEWRQLNLLDTDRVATLGRFDLILCRNVLIYFADATVVSVVGALASNLSPAGLLVVGASESLMRFGTVLECSERAGAFFYGRSTGR